MSLTYEPLILYIEAAAIYLLFSTALAKCKTAWSAIPSPHK
ncbi:hypothetical protein [Sodalis sp.]